MRSLISGLSARFFGMSTLGLAVAVGAGAFRLGEDPGEPDDGGVRAAALDDPGHQRDCPTCQAMRAWAERDGDRMGGPGVRGR